VAQSGVNESLKGSTCRTKGRRIWKLDEVDFEIQNHEILKLDDPSVAGQFEIKVMSPPARGSRADPSLQEGNMTSVSN
jgi:hypothetical protein